MEQTFGIFSNQESIMYATEERAEDRKRNEESAIENLDLLTCWSGRSLAVVEPHPLSVRWNPENEGHVKDPRVRLA